MIKKRIVFFTESMIGAGGVVRVISMWANYFCKENDIEIISVYEGEPYFKLNKHIKFTICGFNFKNKILGLVKNIYTMYKILKKRENSIIIVNKSLYIEPLYFWKKLGFFKNVKMIYFVHGGSSDFESFYLKRFWIRHRVKMIFTTFDRVICLYKDCETSELPKQVDSSKIVYIPNPIPYNEVEKNLEKEKIVLYLGRVTKEKGVDILIKAWSELKKDSIYEEWMLKIVGDGKDRDSFITLADKLELKDIYFESATKMPEKFYKKSKIYVLPSLSEGMPMTILEAKNFKNIVISSKTSGGKKLILNGKNGYLFDINCEKQLVEKLKLAIFESEKFKDYSNNPIIMNSDKQIDEYRIEKIGKKWKKILN